MNIFCANKLFDADERDNLSEMNGDMVVSVADFLDKAGDDDLEMDEDGGLTSKHMKFWKICMESLKGIVKNWQCLVLILLGMILS